MGKSRKKFTEDFPKVKREKIKFRHDPHVTDSEPVYRIGRSVQVDADDVHYPFE